MGCTIGKSAAVGNSRQNHSGALCKTAKTKGRRTLKKAESNIRISYIYRKQHIRSSLFLMYR